MDKWIKSPWFIRITSLVLAMLLFVSVNLDENTSRSDATFIPAGSNEVATIADVPLQVIMDNEKYVVSGMPQNVSVTLEGPNSILTPIIRQNNLEVYVDLEGLEPGSHEVNLKHKGISNRISVYIEPKTILINLEERSSGSFPVEVDFINKQEIEEGYTIGEPTILPESVEITGSKTEVDRVAIVKAIVDVKGAKSSIILKDAPVRVYDANGNELNVIVEPSVVRVNASIESPSKVVPFEVTTQGELPEGLRLVSITSQPEEVTVYGPTRNLDLLTLINNVNFDLTTITEDITIDVDVPIPPGAEKVEPATIQVSVDVEKIEEKLIAGIAIEVLNLAEGKEVIIIEPNDETISLTAFGTPDELTDITLEDFNAFIDLEEFPEGEHMLNVNISAPSHITYETEYQKVFVRIK